MNNLWSALSGWAKDPFGKKKRIAENRKVILELTETRVRVEETLKRTPPYPFPISNMISNDYNRKG